MNGGEIIAKFLASQGVKFLFTLIGGHISPIMTGCKKENIRVIDVRHEVNTVFAADAVSRLTGVPGVAAVTAGPGLTNTITAVKNAYMAQSPLILIGGATATVLEGRGSLQDIDQMSLMKPHVKMAIAIKRVKDIVPTFEKAFRVAQEGVPGPVFLECPIDLLYGEETVRELYGIKDGVKPKSFPDKLMNWYLKRAANKMFRGKDNFKIPTERIISDGMKRHNLGDIKKVASQIKKASKPLMLIGSQVLLNTKEINQLVRAVEKLGVPVYLTGMARGLLGKDHPLQLRHNRKAALKDADLVLLAGVPCDFRLDYGRHIPRKAKHISINRSKEDLTKNKRPHIGLLTDPGKFLIDLAASLDAQKDRLSFWIENLKKGDEQREIQIDKKAKDSVDKGINPIELFRKMDLQLSDDSALIVDGGDFVATGAYTLQPRKPLSWLDPGVFGTLGVGAGFALGAKLVRPETEVWIIWGDGSSAYSIAEYDTFVRHNIPVISVIGNDASWSQIARDQVKILGDDVATVLAYNDYDVVVKGFGAQGRKVDTIKEFEEVVKEAKKAAREGKPYVINAIIGKSDFREGSLSM